MKQTSYFLIENKINKNKKKTDSVCVIMDDRLLVCITIFTCFINSQYSISRWLIFHGFALNIKKTHVRHFV